MVGLLARRIAVKRRDLTAGLIAGLLILRGAPTIAAGLSAQPYDIVIENGHIVDGSGSPWYAADLAIRDGRIAAIGRLHHAPARHRIDARGKVVAPGFIDMLGQSELTLLVNPHVPSKIFQGITTEVTGEGSSAAPLNDAIIQADAVAYAHLHIKPDWRNFSEYFARLEKQGIGINFASYVGATQVRRMVLGDDNRAPTAAELTRMRALVRDAMRQGAFGLSTSLQYAPAPYASTEELIALASEAGAFGGIYATHMRSEGNAQMAAIDEAIRIGREAGTPVEIWHIKSAGKENWGRMPQLVAKIDAARRSGLDISANTYAYTAWSNSLSAFVPPWAHAGGDSKLIERLKDPQTRQRIIHEMESPASDWDNEWQEIAGPEAVLVRVVQNPSDLLRRFEPTGEKFIIGARISGAAKTAFPNGAPNAPAKPPAEPGAAPKPDSGALPAQVKEAKDINVIVVADSDMFDDRFWVQVQNLLGQRVATPSADNGALVMNAVENMMGSNGLISLRTRERSARPFVVVDRIRRDAEGRFLAEQQALQEKVNTTQANLRALQGQNQQNPAAGAPVLNKEQQAQVDKLRRDLVDTRASLRQVQASLRQNVESLGTVLAFLNIALVPILIGAAAIALSFLRRRRRARAMGL